MDPRAEDNRWQAWRLPGLLVGGMVAAAIIGFVFVSQVLLPGKPAAMAASVDPKTLGPVDAAIEVIEYSDFQ